MVLPSRRTEITVGLHDSNRPVDEGTATGAATALLARLLSGAFVAGQAAAKGLGRVHAMLAVAAGAVGALNGLGRLGAVLAVAGGAVGALDGLGRLGAVLGVAAGAVGALVGASIGLVVTRPVAATAAVACAVAQRTRRSLVVMFAAVGRTCASAVRRIAVVTRPARASIESHRWQIVCVLSVAILGAPEPLASGARIVSMEVMGSALMLAAPVVVAPLAIAALPLVGLVVLTRLVVSRVLWPSLLPIAQLAWYWLIRLDRVIASRVVLAARWCAHGAAAGFAAAARILERLPHWLARTAGVRLALAARILVRLSHWLARNAGVRLALAAHWSARAAAAGWAVGACLIERSWHRLTQVVGPPAARAWRRAATVGGALLGRLRGRVEGLVGRVTSTIERCVRYAAFTRDRVAFAGGVALARARVRTASPRAATVPLEHAPVTRQDVTRGFTATVFQNEYLPEGAREVHAIVSVTSSVERGEGSPDPAVVILLDCSGSMGRPWSKLQAVRRATEAAVDTLGDGTWFAIVRGSDRAEVAYPPSAQLVRSTPETRAAAKRAVRLLWPDGGTAMGRWLLAARDLFAVCPGAIPRAILLTDGRNESEGAASLEAALEACAGQFQCDCRGIGADWSVHELQTISTRLLGTIDAIAAPELLTPDFEAMAAAAMGRSVGEVRLDVKTPRGGSVLHLSQAAPEWTQLPATEPADDGVYRCPTGAWGAETRDYHLCIGVPAGSVGDEMIAARIDVVVDGGVAAQLRVRATWCDDERTSTATHPAVAHYVTQAQLVASIGRGLEARASGDVATATRELARAAQLADARTMRLLEAVVDVEDASTGVVRMKPTVDPIGEVTLAARSTRTSAWVGHGQPEAPTMEVGNDPA